MPEMPQAIATIGDCLESVVDYRGKTPPKSPSGIPTITAANVKSGRIDLSIVSYVSEKTYWEWSTRGFPQSGDILITTEAPVGEVAPFPGDQTYLITRRVFAMRGKAGVLDNRYLLYACLSSIVQDELQARIRGSTVPRVLKTDILGLKIPLPAIEEQKAIAHILGTLDDKIELNRKTNETLEAMAKALFKSWFVDFDPVRAKAEGRNTGLPAEISDLFPDSFEDSELGEIPSGWEVAQLGDVLEVDKGVSYKGDFLSDSEGLPMVNLGCFAGGGAFRQEKMKFYAGEHRERHIAQRSCHYSALEGKREISVFSPHIRCALQAEGRCFEVVCLFHLSETLLQANRCWSRHWHNSSGVAEGWHN
jgi:type I restriction enzyme S subunit